MSEQNAESHPLATSWVFWEMGTEKDYAAAVRQLGDPFSSVESFWNYWSSTLKPSDVFSDGVKKVLVDGREIKALALFREGIKPAWEDPLNMNGSDVVCAKSLSLEAADLHWEAIVFALIGEVLDNEQYICGARCVFRQKGKGQFKFEMWVKDMNEERAFQLRARLADILAVSNLSCKPAFQLVEADFIHDKRGKDESHTPKGGKKY
mmetsp:Transcript_40182/g.29641  ORF Transcript_40182/g.29641 Transcript_40182/m.29641 type:complete len:207 (+) Transcript_40182:78-698(+)